MRAFIDLLDNMTNTVRVIAGLFVVCMTLFGLVASFGFSYAAPAAIEEMTEKAIQAHEREMDAALEARRNQELAKDGWGYGSGERASEDTVSGYKERAQNRKDGWGND